MPPTLTEVLLSAIEHSTVPMTLSDPHAPDNPIVAANPAFAAMTGFPLGEIIGRNCRFLQGPDTDPATLRRIRQSIADEQGCVEWIVNRRRNGKPFWNLLFLSPVHDRDGRLVHFFGNQMDITTGLPSERAEVVFGRAHMSRDNQAEFNALVLDDVTRAEHPAARAAALQGVVTRARRLAELSSALAPGDTPAIPPL